MEKESENKINFLDLTKQKETNKFIFKAHSKPTTTVFIITLHSCHPQEHKHAAICLMINRMNTYSLNKADKEDEKNTIKHIISNNKYDTATINTLGKHKNNRKHQSGTKWAKFTYIGKETKFNTKLFKDSPINITFTTRQTIKKLLSYYPQPAHDKFDNSGVYEMTCPDSHKKYIGQTSRSFQIRFSEHFQDYKYNNHKSKFAHHLLDSGHSIGPIDDIMKVLYTTNKGKLMDTIERFYTHKETHLNNQINNRNTIKPNFIFDTVILSNTNRVHTNENANRAT
jgi:hypothetical protein